MRWTLLVSIVLALTMFVAACGGDDDDDGGTATQPAQGGEPKEGKKGGKVTFLAAADVDFVDPGQTYYTFGYMVHYAVNRTLYSFEPQEGDVPVADIADGEPQISSDNKTITVKLKKGIKYAPPVNREVKADDVKYAFERAFSANVPNGYAGAYFGSIVGVPEELPKKPGSISGITTPDDSTVVFTLKEAQAPLVSQALVMPITTPVPREYAEKFDAKSPSTYDQYVAFTGPYMIKNDASTGKLTGRQPGKQIQLVRNPNWDAKTDYRPAYLDEVTIEEGNEDLTVASRRTLSGNGLLCCDAGQPPIPVLKSAITSQKDQLALTPSGGTRYISFNTTVKPFDNLNLRKGIIAAMDRTSLLKTRGGAFIGDVATGWIPPGIPGFEEAGGLKQNTDLDFLAKPEGDPEVSKKYMLAAKEDGLPIDAGGKWTGSEKVLVIATNADPGKKTAENFQGQIEKLGFKLNLRIVPQDTLYTKFCNVPKNDIAICPNVGWFKDFADPQSMLDVTFNGKNIVAQNNSNWPELDVPEINDAMTAAATIPIGKERNEAWAKIGHMIAEQAPAIPFSWDKSASIASKDVNMVASEYFTTADLSFSSLK